jgi:hypothetical protein
MYGYNGSGDATPSSPSPTHGGRLRHRKRSSEVILLPLCKEMPLVLGYSCGEIMLHIAFFVVIFYV